MQKRVTVLFLLLFVVTGLVSAQTMQITTYGVSPREAGLSDNDIFTSAYNGLTNVGVGTKMYLKATLAGGRLNDPQWSTTERAPGSNPTFGGVLDVDTSSQIIVFTPDKPGKYVVQVSDGPYSASIVINAAKYIGVYNEVNNVTCQTCHPSVVEKWEGTGHASMLFRGVEGTLSDHYSANCISCHTTGYDVNAENDGFDDFEFVFPETLTEGTYQTLVDQYPDAMKRANIQCESCHGPASGHFGSTKDSRIVVSYEAANCAFCHDDGHYHVYPEQWDVSRHAEATSYPTGPGRESCVRCHTAKGFAQFVKGIATNDPYFDPSYQPITCAGCHDPHDATNMHQVRTVNASLADGTVIEQGGLGKLCMNCHQSRRVANSSYTETPSRHYGPHYSTAADVLNAANVVTFGDTLFTLASTNHLGVTENGCVDCHMAEGETDASGHAQLVGKHTFSMSTPTGVDNMKACAKCHGYSLGASFEDVRFFLNGSGDHDGDGVVEGLQDEVHGLLDYLGSLLPDPDPHATPDTTWTKEQLQAAYNMRVIYYDGSYGIHNPKFTVTLLKGTIKALGGVVSVEESKEVPTNYALYQNYPNPFNPTTNIKFSLPKASHVKLTVYDVLGKEVQTLVNNQLSAGTHTIAFNGANLASGVYLYRIESGDFVQVNKMLLVK
jgi:hypothetical protein